MKILNVAMVVLLFSCSNTSIFPVSRVAPSAEMSAKKSRDDHRNYILEVTIRNLVAPERIEPPGKNYSIWIVTDELGVINVGQLKAEKMKRMKFVTVTPYDFSEIFITVENSGNLTYPSGLEIARTRI